MLRPIGLLAVAVGALLALVPASAAPAKQASMLRTSEVGCYEFNEIARVPIANLRTAVPAGYTVRPGTLDPTVGFITFVDYACESLTVNGFTWPHRTLVTMGLAVLSARNGVPGLPYYILWHATNNPHLANALRKLGIPSHTISATDQVITIDATHSRIEMRYRGAQVDHERSAEVVEPQGPIEQSTSGLFYHLGERGEVLLTYANRVRSTRTARTQVSVDDKSYLAALGVPATLVVSNTMFIRGDWNGAATLS